MLTGMSGPLVVYGSRNPLGTGAGGSNNPDAAPSLLYSGYGFMDPRAGYNVTKAGAIGLGGASAVMNVVPAAAAANNIAASQSPAAGAITLVSATGAGIVVLAAPLTVWSSGSIIPTGALVIDIAPGLLQYGLASVSNGYTKVSFYDPTKSIARGVRYVSGGNDSGITFTMTGYDVYGYPMTETVTGANAGTALGKKAFKFITGVTASGSVAGTLTIGTTDLIGLPMRSDVWGDQEIVWNSNWITASTGYTAADTTSPATSITGDSRGTWLITGAASDGTKRLVMYCNPLASNLASTVGLFGVTPA